MQLNPSTSWTLSFAKEWWPYLSPLSVLRWRDAVVRTDAGLLPVDDTVTLRFKAPVRGDVRLRSASSDAYTLQEIMIRQVYSGLRAWVPECRTIIDLGANIGLASLYLATLYPDSHIVAVEPFTDNVGILRGNLSRLIQTGRVSVLQAAVWSRSTKLEFASLPDPGAYDSVTMLECDEESASPVMGMPAGEIINRSGFDQVDILKVDIEGAEVQLFEGDTSWLKKVANIAIEFHGDSRRQSGFDALMRECGFEIVDENHHTVLAQRRKG